MEAFMFYRFAGDLPPARSHQALEIGIRGDREKYVEMGGAPFLKFQDPQINQAMNLAREPAHKNIKVFFDRLAAVGNLLVIGKAKLGD